MTQNEVAIQLIGVALENKHRSAELIKNKFELRTAQEISLAISHTADRFLKAAKIKLDDYFHNGAKTADFKGYRLMLFCREFYLVEQAIVNYSIHEYNTYLKSLDLFDRVRMRLGGERPEQDLHSFLEV